MKTPQFELFHDDVYAALRVCIDSMGGAKRVGGKLWGDSQPPHKLAEKINNCLNPSHKQKFSLIELLWILRKSHDAGCHAAINFICREVGYSDPQPLDPEDEKSELQRQFMKSVSELKTLSNRINAINGTGS